MRALHLFCCSILFYTAVFAQPRGTNIFTNYQKKDGLLSNQVFAVAQDKTGYIWIGTDNGLQRFDGFRYLDFRHNPADSGSIPGDLMSLLYTDKKGRLWVVSSKAAGVFNTSTYRFRKANIKTSEAALNKSIKKIFEDKKGRLMAFVGKDSLLTYNEEKNEFSSAYNFIHPPQGWVCEDIVQDPVTDEFWLTTKNGLLLYNEKKNQYSYRGNNPDNNPIIAEFEKLDFTRRPYFDKQGRFWLGRWIPFQGPPDLYCYDRKENKVTAFQPGITNLLKIYHEIWGMIEQSNGDMWIYGYELFLHLNKETNQFEKVRDETLNENNIRFDYIMNVFTDREENLWIASNYGLFLFNPTSQLFTNVKNRKFDDTTVNNRPVTTVITTSKKNIWVGTLGNGIFAYDSLLNPLPDPLRVNNRKNFDKMGIWHLALRKNGDTWVGAQNGNLIIFDSDDHMLADLTPTILEKKSIRQVVEDTEGNMWLGTEGGHLVKCEKGNWADSINSFKLLHKVDGRIMKILQDRNGFIWTATELSGIFKFDPRTGKELAHYDDKSGPGRSLTSVFTTDLLQYNDSLLFIANGNISILNTKRNTITYFSTIDGLPSNQIGGFFKDDAGHIWITLSDGLCRLNVEKKVVSVFDVKDGITEDNFEVSSTGSLPGGRIAMGTLHDFLLFNPAHIDKQAIPLDVIITDIKLAGRSLTVDSIQKLNKLSLAYTENNITIDYSVLCYMQQNRIVYYHKLEGLDKDWIRCDYHQAVYHYLPPGTYTFKIKSFDGQGNVSEKETQLVIVVSSPFWKTWWFYAALTLLVISIVYLIDKERMRKLIALQKMRTQIAGNLHRELNSTLNNISLLSEMAKLKADKDITRSKEYIDQISEKSTKMIISMDDMLWSLDPQNDNMEKTILRMHEFTDALKNRHNADIQMQIDKNVHSLELDMKSRHEFFLLFKLALRMVVEQGHGKNVLINIDLVRPKLSLKINDAEAKLDLSSPETEHYFLEMKSRAKEINALLDILADTKGTSIILLVPVV